MIMKFEKERELLSKRKRGTYIGVELANEAREVAVVEVFREESACKLVRVPNNEAVPCLAPRDQ